MDKNKRANISENSEMKIDEYLHRGIKYLNGLPSTVYQNLSAKQKFLINKKPVVSKCIDLSCVPQFVTDENNITKKNQNRFLNKPSNKTQKSREMYEIWIYGSILNALMKTESYVGILQPVVDNGIDGYIRVVNINPFKIYYIPIQVAEIRILGPSGNVEMNSVQKLITSKSKPSQLQNTTLLCSFRGESCNYLNVDFYLLRDRISSIGYWPFRKIVLVGNMSGNNFALTLYDKAARYFFLIKKGNEVDVYHGLTIDEMNHNKEIKYDFTAIDIFY